MEALGYAVGAADLCAAGIGAPHIRQRLWFVGLAYSDCKRLHRESILLRGNKPGWIPKEDTETAGGRKDGGVADAYSQQWNGRWNDRQRRRVESAIGRSIGAASKTESHWRNADWLWCRDGKWRPVEPGTFPLAYGVSGMVAHLRGYGNAIVPQVAATFIKAALST